MLPLCLVVNALRGKHVIQLHQFFYRHFLTLGPNSWDIAFHVFKISKSIDVGLTLLSFSKFQINRAHDFGAKTCVTSKKNYPTGQVLGH